MYISLFKNNYDTQARSVNLKHIVALIKSSNMREKIKQLRSSDDDERKRLKQKLYCFTISAQINQRGIKHIKSSTGVMLFDYDDIKSDEYATQLIESIKDHLGSDLLLAFKSPNLGVKFAIKTDLKTTDNGLFKYCYKQKLIQLETQLGIKLDKSTCDITRLCNLSYDENIYFNPDSNTFDINKEWVSEYGIKAKKLKRIQSLRSQLHESKITNLDKKRQRIMCEQALTRFKQQDIKGSRHNALFIYGMTLFKAGCTKHEVMQKFKLLGSSYTETQSIENYVIDLLGRFMRTSLITDWVYKVETI